MNKTEIPPGGESRDDNPMTQNPSSHAGSVPPPAEGHPDDVRFRFIGFEVYPVHIPKFWKSEAEANQYTKNVQLGGGVSSLERDFSLLRDVAMSAVDRIVLAAVGAIMILAVALPWVSYRAMGGSRFTLSWVGALGTLFGGFSTAFAGGFAVGLSAILGLLLLIATPILGIWMLASVWMKAPSADAYQARLRLPLRMGYAVFLDGLAITLLSLIGGAIPGFASWGLIDPGESYGFGTLFTLLSYGPYAAMGAGLIAAVKSGDL